MRNNYLLDKEFLNQIDNDRNRIVYVKLISLDFDENPQEEIIGRITSGSINIDGSSAVRRTCSLSLIANELNINEYYWGLKTKFKCFIGLENRINNSYPNPIWFPMGTYLITSFTCSQALANFTISIQGKDKMCLLNGDIGGTITAISVDFGQMSEQQKDGSIIKTKLLLKDIIREGVHEYAREPYHNIIINDMDEAALELLEYRGTSDLFLIVNGTNNEVRESTLDPNTTYFLSDGTSIAIGDLSEENYDRRIELNLDKTNQPLKLYSVRPSDPRFDINNFNTIIKVQYGEVVGYRLTDLTFAGDLIGSIGESFTSVLDKIKNMLGDYEYFYNLEGNFVWQRRQTYINISWNNIQQSSEKEAYAENAAYTSAVTYSFENGNLITARSHNPEIQNIKNDYSVFGVRKTTSDVEIPVHIRYAIDQKPTYYKAWDGTIYSTEPLSFQDFIAEQQKEQDELVQQIISYPKQPLPEGLSDDWWDVWDWGEYYKLLTSTKTQEGHYPTGQMWQYATATTKIDLESLFEVVNSLPISPQIPNISAGHWTKPNRPCYLFDTLKIDETTYLCFTGHNPGENSTSLHSCGHYYDTYFMDLYRRARERGYEFHAYFYKPTIPGQTEVELKIKEIQEQIKEESKKYHNVVVDWREIIWRMADDYMKHSMQDPKYELNPNNFEEIENLSELEFSKGGYYIRKEKYVQALEYHAQTKYYTYELINEETGEYGFVECTEPLSATDFDYRNIELPLRIYYYYKEVTPDYVEVSIDDEFDPNQTYYKYIEYTDRLRQYNPDLYPNGFTGYEQYYTDIKSFWRDLYNPDYIEEYKITSTNQKMLCGPDGNQYYWFKNQEEETYDPEAIYYTQDLYGTLRAHSINKIKQIEFENHPDYYFLPIQMGLDPFIQVSLTEAQYQKHKYYINKGDVSKNEKDYRLSNNDYDANQIYFEINPELDDYVYKNNRIYYVKTEKQYYSQYEAMYIYDENGHYVEKTPEQLAALDESAIANYQNRKYEFANRYWNKKIWTAPEKLDFWFDFLDTEGDLGKFSVKRIGDRPKTENNTNIKAVYYRETPNVIFVDSDEEINELKKTKTGYTFLSLNDNVNHLFTISSQGQSCKDKLNSLLYDFAVCKQSITLTTIPIYYLQPNTRIFITDLESGINGEYIISRLGYNLATNGTLSITASKAVDRIY